MTCQHVLTRYRLQEVEGEASGLFGGPVAWVCYGIVIVVLLWPLVARLRRVVDRGTGNDDGPRDDDRPSGPVSTTSIHTWEGPGS